MAETLAATTTATPKAAAISTNGTAPATTPRRRARRKTPEMRPIWEAYRETGNPALRNQIIETYLYLVRMIGNRIAARLPRSIDVEDLRSAGVFGLMRAVENYDLTLGTPFESYCAMRVRGAILDELRAQDWVPRLVRNRSSQYKKAHARVSDRLEREPSVHELADEMKCTVAEAAKLARESNLTTVYTLCQQDDRDDDPRGLRRLDALMDQDSDMPFERMVATDLAHALVTVLTKAESTVVALYYKEGLTMKEIGRVMGISESRVCQIHTKTLKRLREHIRRLQDQGRLSHALSQQVPSKN